MRYLKRPAWLTFWGLYAIVYDRLCYLRPYRDMIVEAADLLAVLGATSRILNLGCGTGNLERELAADRYTGALVGVDTSSSMLQRARTKNPGMRHTFVCADLNDPLFGPVYDQPFQGLASINVLYILADPTTALTRAAALAAPGATLVVSTPREGAQIRAILRAHLQAARADGQLRQSLSSVGAFVLIAILNLVIQLRQKRGQYHFPDETQLRQWFTTAGWTIAQLTYTYADQNYLVVAHPALAPSETETE